MTKIVFITSGQPSLNPRLVKEADALADAGYQVTVLYAYWNNWGTRYDLQLIPSKKWNAVCAGGNPKNKPLTYALSRVIYKTAKLIIQKTGSLNYFAELSIARSSFFLTREAKKHKADLYIGHNLGALAATIKAAKKYQAKCGFDAEDYHRQEVSDDPESFTYKVAKYIEDKYYKELDYITASSPQIANAYQRLYPAKNPVTILNVFPNSTPVPKPAFNSHGPIKIFWFSQTIGISRGLEDISRAFKFLKSVNFELHLLGDIAADYKQNFINNVLEGIPNVFFYDPIPPDEIIDFASKFDIGLASENTIPLNRDLCLTNKIFTYLQAGLAIIASDTTAQKSFLEENPDIGKIYHKDDIESLADLLSAYQSNREMLFNTCNAALKRGRDKLSWENESVKFLSLINTTLKN